MLKFLQCYSDSSSDQRIQVAWNNDSYSKTDILHHVIAHENPPYWAAFRLGKREGIEASVLKYHRERFRVRKYIYQLNANK